MRPLALLLAVLISTPALATGWHKPKPPQTPNTNIRNSNTNKNANVNLNANRNRNRNVNNNRNRNSNRNANVNLNQNRNKQRQGQRQGQRQNQNAIAGNINNIDIGVGGVGGWGGWFDVWRPIYQATPWNPPLAPIQPSPNFEQTRPEAAWYTTQPSFMYGGVRYMILE